MRLALKTNVPRPAQIDHYRSPRRESLVGTLPAPQYVIATDRKWQRIQHVLVPDCQPGDILSCKASFEITNDLPFLVELGACLYLSPHASGMDGIESKSWTVPEVMTNSVPGFNVTPNQCANFPHGGMHHAVMLLHADYSVPDGIAGDRYVAIFAYCAGLNPWPTNDTVKVERSCSDVSVMRVR